jgi:glutamine cyclotransferase
VGQGEFIDSLIGDLSLVASPLMVIAKRPVFISQHRHRKFRSRFAGCCVLAIMLLHVACRRSAGPDNSFSLSSQVPSDSFDVIRSWPHDPTAFTEGLIFDQGLLWESTGQHGSSLRQIEPETGKILRKIDVPPEYYAEGITIFQGKLFQLTYQEHKALVYDLNSLQVLQVLNYEGEGWGLTHDDQSLIMTDGTNRIRFLDPVDFRPVRSIEVYDAGRPVDRLNELEYVKGEIYANIWRTNLIIRISPASGKILGVIDVGRLFPQADRHGDNAAWPEGIAYDHTNDRVFVTGKHWPKIFEIRVGRNQVELL